MSVLEENITKITNDYVFHEWCHNDSFETLASFKKFINWLSGEFSLFQQNENEGLTIFFPSGRVTVKELEIDKRVIKFSVKVKSKYSKKGAEIFSQVICILQHLKGF